MSVAYRKQVSSRRWVGCTFCLSSQSNHRTYVLCPDTLRGYGDCLIPGSWERGFVAAKLCDDLAREPNARDTKANDRPFGVKTKQCALCPSADCGTEAPPGLPLLTSVGSVIYSYVYKASAYERFPRFLAWVTNTRRQQHLPPRIT